MENDSNSSDSKSEEESATGRSVAEELGYSDSEEDEHSAPHYPDVKNYTKKPPLWWIDHFEGVRRAFQNVELGSLDQIVPSSRATTEPDDNWVLTRLLRVDNSGDPEQSTFAETLENDAREIQDKMPCTSQSTVICVALRRCRGGAIKKFVFTNGHAYYVQWNEDNTYNVFFRTAHSLGYHVAQAQQSHAEAQLLQFLQERPNTYEGIPLAIGWSRRVCPTCWGLLVAFWGQEHFKNGGRFGNAKKDSRTTEHWYTPPALIACVTYIWNKDGTAAKEFRKKQALEKAEYWKYIKGYDYTDYTDGCDTWAPGKKVITKCEKLDSKVNHKWHKKQMDTATGATEART